jgi:hypothetical protein
MKKLILAVLLVTGINTLGIAQDRLFTYTYQTNVLNKNDREIEVWNTFKFGRSEFYRAFNHRIEYEMGLGSNFQTSVYLNLKTFSAKEGASMNSGTDISFSNEWKYKMSDPVANSVGSALYAEVGVGKDEVELETKLILDKQIGKSLHALNLVAEFASEKGFEGADFKTIHETKLEVNYGFSYKIKDNLNLGFELMQDNVLNKGELEYSSLFAGPVVAHYGKNYWVNFTIFPQIYSFKGATNNNLDLAHHEKIETRLIFSFQL